MITIERLLDLEGDAERLTAKIREAIQAERDKPVADKPPAGIDPADLQNEINELRPGDTLTVAPGVLYGTVEIRDKPGVTIRAAVPGETRVSGLWEAADRGETKWIRKWGAWSAKHGDSHLASVDDRFLFRYGGSRPVDALKSGSLLGHKTPDYGYAHNNGEIFLRIPGGEDPNGRSIKMCDKESRSIIRIRNSPDVTIDGIQIEGSGDADAVLPDPESERLAVVNCVFTHCRRAVRMPHNSTMRWCEYRYDGFWRFYQDLIKLNGSGSAAPFDMVKKHWTGSRGALLEGGMCESLHGSGSRGCEVSYCYMHSVFDGQRIGAFIGLNSHHNIYQNCLDDAAEFESHLATRSGSGNREHHSLIMDCVGSGFSHQDASGGMTGEAWVDNCLFVSDEVHTPMFIKLMNVKAPIAYAHCEFVFKAGKSDGWGEKLVLAQGMKGQKVPNKLRILNSVLRGDTPDPISGSPIIKGTARARNTTEALDIPPADLGPIERHAFIGPNVPDDLTDWPRPMRRAFNR